MNNKNEQLIQLEQPFIFKKGQQVNISAFLQACKEFNVVAINPQEDIILDAFRNLTALESKLLKQNEELIKENEEFKNKLNTIIDKKVKK